MIYNHPYLGKIKLKKIGESTRHLIGETIYETIYIDNSRNFYIFISGAGIHEDTIINVSRDLFNRLLKCDKKMFKYDWKIYSEKLKTARRIVRTIKGEPKTSHEIANEFNMVGEVARILYKKK